MSLAERHDRDDELRGVAERGIEKAAQRRPGAFSEFLGSEPDHAGERDQGYRGSEEYPLRVRRDDGRAPTTTARTR